MTLAPIILFAYNRPEHTRRTLDALRCNALASESILYIYADGPKDTATALERKSVEETREVIKEQQWCGEVQIVASISNRGLASSILSGVTEVIEKYGKIIVLEDDIVVTAHFLTYMNTALEYFESTKEVFHVNGFNNTSDFQFLLKDYYFLQFMSCWGWATWKDRWDYLNRNHSFYLNKLKADSALLSKFNYDNVLSFHNQLEDNVKGNIDTWAILWFCTVFFNDGLCITPKYSFVENIGLDGSGVHCDNIAVKQKVIAPKNIKFEACFQKLSLSESFFSRLHLKLFYRYGATISLKKITEKIKRSLQR